MSSSLKESIIRFAEANPPSSAKGFIHLENHDFDSDNEFLELNASSLRALGISNIVVAKMDNIARKGMFYNSRWAKKNYYNSLRELKNSNDCSIC